MTSEQLQSAYDELLQEGHELAGGLTDLAQRATVYHHIFRESGGGHIFPLIAAHGALWGRGWFAFGLRLARGLVWQFPFSKRARQEKLAALDEFADAFRDINRRVCIDTYANFHFTRRFGDQPAASEIIPGALLNALNRIHASNDQGTPLTDAEKRDVFYSHFLYEQDTIVGSTVTSACAKLNWPLVKAIALRPVVSFAYLQKRIWFRDFSSRDERIKNGLRAFDMAAQVGWERVESALDDYGVQPTSILSLGGEASPTFWGMPNTPRLA